MSSLPPEIIRDRVCAQLAVADAAQARLRGLSTDLVGNAFRIEVAGRLETQERVTRGLSYRLRSPTRPMARMIRGCRRG